MEGRIPERWTQEYWPKDKAYEIAKRWTGQDFGHDVNAWKEWIANNKEKLSVDSYRDAVWAVLKPDPNDSADDPEELARMDARMEEIKRELAKDRLSKARGGKR
jgi:hypothetical protein